MKRFLTLAVLGVALAFQLNAQSVSDSYALQQIKENPYRCALVFNVYEPLDTVDTPAPDGYKAFYVSHIGRHGSRYHSAHWKNVFVNASKRFNDFAEAGALTETGLKVQEALNKVIEVHEGKWGDLSPLGAQEHRQIARRMYQRVPEVFTDPARKEVVCVNTGAKRCVASQENFVAQLKDLQPDLKFSSFATTSNRELVPKVKGIAVDKERLAAEIKPVTEATKKEAVTTKFNADRMAELLFVDGKKTKGYYPKLISTLRTVFVINACIPDEIYDVIGLFTPEELYALWSEQNYSNFLSMGNCKETKHLKPLNVGGEIMRNIILDADEAIAGGKRAADLRFSHDTFVQPTLAFLSGSGNEEASAKDANTAWMSSRSVCMGVNIQFVFYRSDARKDILVKVLHNEKEIVLPSALKPVSGPYYKWKDVKSYYLKKLK